MCGGNKLGSRYLSPGGYGPRLTGLREEGRGAGLLGLREEGLGAGTPGSEGGGAGGLHSQV